MMQTKAISTSEAPALIINIAPKHRKAPIIETDHGVLKVGRQEGLAITP